jgi:RNA polymerase sigma-70 factor (ECF subfamily)
VDPSDLLLVGRLRRGDRDACRDLIRRHHAIVYGHLRRLGADAALADDLTQETYARAWSRIDSLREAASLRAWLLAIARNEFFQVVRARGPETIAPSEPGDRAAADPGPDCVVAEAERDARLHGAVDRLEPELRDTVALHYFQDLSISEVGSVLGIPSGTVKSRLNRALGQLREQLAPEAFGHG